MQSYDVVVVGGGNAAMCSALSAAEHGAKVAVFEKAPESERGGNSSYTAGSWRVAYDGQQDALDIMSDLSEREAEKYDFGSYTAEDFLDDLGRLTQYRTDPDLCEILVNDSKEILHWLKTKGLRFLPYMRQSAKSGDKLKWFGGSTIESVGGGIGLVDAQYKAAEEAGVDIFYDSPVTDLITEGGKVTGVVVTRDGVDERVPARAVILAAGGFEANAEWRARYLGPGWDLAKVRGTRYNTGDGIKLALDNGAQARGHWSGCHAVSWERNAPDFGEREIGELFSKHSYLFGVMVNLDGKRFVDEGADFFIYTYAKYGREVLSQPGQVAWQIFDSQTAHLLREDYRIKQITKVSADTLEELADKMEDVNKPTFLDTIRRYNDSIRADVDFDPTIRDGKSTQGLDLPKSNWAMPISKPPFEAYAVTCGVTFTFGGVKINSDAQVLSVFDRPIPGLYAAGEMVGGIFYFNYPGGSGLTNGAVFGRRAGRHAASLI